MIEPVSPIGESPEWLEALEKASFIAPLDRSILIIGERGTGKELIGERVHFLSKRWNGPFIKVNCAALSDELLDSELFGHEQVGLLDKLRLEENACDDHTSDEEAPAFHRTT